jgi:hypothetical protein
MCAAVDVATVRMALAVIDIVLHAWHPSNAAEATLLFDEDFVILDF